MSALFFEGLFQKGALQFRKRNMIETLVMKTTRPHTSDSLQDPIAVVMGVSGAGKSTIGRHLAEHLGWQFVEGDGFHPPENVAKMAAGDPLTDGDRWAWLDALREAIHLAGESVVVSCSALKPIHRHRLLDGLSPVILIALTAPREVLLQRLAQRTDHFFPPSLLDSQLDALVMPEPSEAELVLEVSVARSVEAVVDEIVTRIRAE